MTRAKTTVQNAEIATALEEIADLLAIEGANAFRVRAYRNAARELRSMARPIAERVEQGEDLSKLPGIGTGIAKKIEEIVRTGHLGYLEQLEQELGEALPELLRVPGLGPKRVQALHEQLGVSSVDELRRAAQAGRLRELEGFGEKTEEKILAALRKRTRKKERRLASEVAPVAELLVEYLRALEGVQLVEVAGSFRRRRETVGDLDLLVSAKRGVDVPAHFVAQGDVEEVLAHGTTRASVRLRSGLQVDLRVVPRESFGAALHYFTGSKAHNLAVRRMGQARKMKVNEYGVFKASERVAGETEESVYASVGLEYVEPELREDRGELEAAAEGRLPKLVRASDLRGDLHVHTDASDGHDTLRAMAEAARALGHDYLAICDHVGGPAVARGLKEREVRKHVARARKLDERMDGLRVLAGAEVEIGKDGALGLSEELLEELDLVTAAVHSHFDLPRDAQTARVVRALEHPRCHVLAHPSGRLIGKRDPIALDLDGVLGAAAEHGAALELNAQPERLDLDDLGCRAAKEAGVLVAISTDAHATAQLELLDLGVGQARRGWLERADVLNTRTVKQLEKWLRRG